MPRLLTDPVRTARRGSGSRTPETPLFIQFFRRACELVGNEQRLIEPGEWALAELWAEASEQTSNAAQAAPAFASHAADHAEALARIFVELLEAWNIPKESPLRTMDTLLLSFASFLWHDIGMMIPPEEMKNENIETIWALLAVKKEHDRRSLVAIEKLIAASDRFPAWETFWDNAPARQSWPDDPGYWALVVLARICQAHADPLDVWLQPDALDAYQPSSSVLDQETISFRDVYGVREWARVRPVILTSAGILNLCDLLDIRPERYAIPADNWIVPRGLPAEAIDRCDSFFHWFGHQVCTIDIDAEGIRLRPHPDVVPGICVATVAAAGPGGHVLRYGNAEALRQILRVYAQIDFDGIAQELGSTNRRAWNEARARINSDAFHDSWPYESFNEFLLKDEPDELDRKVIGRLWWRGLARRVWRRDENSDLPAESENLGLIGIWSDLMAEGLALDRLVVAHAPQDHATTHHWVVRPPAQQGRTTEALADAFLAAASFCRSGLLVDGRARDIRLAVKGNPLHVALRDGPFEHSSSGAIFLAVLQPGVEASEAAQMVTNTRSLGAEGWDHVIFLTPSTEIAAALEKAGCSPVTWQPDTDKLQRLNKGLVGIHKTGNRHVAEPRDPSAPATPLPEEASPSRVLFAKYMQGAQIEDLRRVVRERLATESEDDRRFAQAIIALQSIGELIHVEARRPPDFLADAYSSFCELSSELELPSLELLRNELGEGAFDQIAPHDGERIPILQARQELLREFLPQQPLLRSAQLATLWWALSRAIAANTNLVCYPAHVPAPLVRTLLRTILNLVPDDIDERELFAFQVKTSLPLVERFAQKTNRDQCRDLAIKVARRWPTLRDAERSITLQREFLAYQIAYRLVRRRGLWTDKKVMKAASEAPTLGLAVIEAVASSRKEDGSRGLTPRSLETARRLGRRLIEAHSEENPFPAVIALDIAFRYARAPFARERLAELRGLAQDLGWQGVGEDKHGLTFTGPIPDANNPIWRWWATVRDLFSDLQQLTPSDVKREALPPKGSEKT